MRHTTMPWMGGKFMKVEMLATESVSAQMMAQRVATQLEGKQKTPSPLELIQLALVLHLDLVRQLRLIHQSRPPHLPVQDLGHSELILTPLLQSQRHLNSRRVL